MNKIFLLIALASAYAFAVAETQDSKAPRTSAAKDSPHGEMLTRPGGVLPLGHPEDIPADIQLGNGGKVLEVLNSDMYTYLKVTTDKEPLWIAAYKADFSKGASVKYSNGVVMSKFYSKALNRTFELIVFVDKVELVK